MTTFLDGPAKGQILMCQRAPLFLRVTFVPQRIDPNPWDALDLIEDAPREGEVLYAYKLQGEAGACFMDWRGKDGRRKGGRFATGSYFFCDPQPTDAQMRETEAWQHWCREQAR